MNNHTYTIYNSLVKRAGFILPGMTSPPPTVPVGEYTNGTGKYKVLPRFKDNRAIMDRTQSATLPAYKPDMSSGTSTGTAGTAMQAPTQAPETYPAVNPATGGTRISYKTGRPIGPVDVNSSIRKGPLPVTPYTSGKVNPNTITLARRQAWLVNSAEEDNNAKKLEVALNFDAMFKDLHDANQKRRAAGLPDYTPSAMDIYAPYAIFGADYKDAENRMYNDIALSTVSAEAARRGTPLNPSEISLLSSYLPTNGEDRLNMLDNPSDFKDYMGIKLDKYTTPDDIGNAANGVTE